MLSEWMKTSVKVAPYSNLAEIYDYVMRHVRYSDWAAYLKRVFVHAEAEVSKVLDISCGTGSLLLELAHLGFDVAGFDASPAMAKVARQKCKDKQVSVEIWCAAMQHFCVSSRFDAVVSTYDSVNYCLTASALNSVFHSVAAAVRPGGVFVFDISTTRNSKQYFRNYYDRGRTASFEYVRQSYYLIQNQRQVNEFYVRRLPHDEGYRYEKHQQRIYTIDEIKSIIPGDDFQLMGVFDGFTLRTGTEMSDRVHFLLMRNG